MAPCPARPPGRERLGSGAAAAALLGASLAVSSCTGTGSRALAISVPYEAETLDPHARNVLSGFALVSNVYEPLVTTDREMRIRPRLARLWENPDPSTWVFHLRPGVRFHSGRALRAADVAASIRRLLGEERLEMGGYVLHVAEVKALDDLTVVVRTTQPLSVLLNKLRFVAVVPEGSTAASLEQEPDGTGPYRVAEWMPGSLLRLARHHGYWGPPAAMEEVTYRLARTPVRAVEDLLDGRAGLVQANDRAAVARVAAAGRHRVWRRDSLFVKYLGFDVAREVSPHVSVRPNPFRRLEVRQAVRLALDLDALVAGLAADAVPARQLVPPAIFGFNPAIPAPRFDRGAARERLRSAGLGGGFAVTLHARAIFADAALLVREQLREVGLAVEVQVEGDREFLGRLQRRDTVFHLSRFGCPTGDASDILDNALHTPDPARHRGGQNYGGYSRPEVDRIIEESAGIESVTERRAALERVAALLMDDVVWAPLFVDQDVYLADPGLRWEPRSDSFVLGEEVAWR